MSTSDVPWSSARIHTERPLPTPTQQRAGPAQATTVSCSVRTRDHKAAEAIDNADLIRRQSTGGCDRNPATLLCLGYGLKKDADDPSAGMRLDRSIHLAFVVHATSRDATLPVVERGGNPFLLREPRRAARLESSQLASVPAARPGCTKGDILLPHAAVNGPQIFPTKVRGRQLIYLLIPR